MTPDPPPLGMASNSNLNAKEIQQRAPDAKPVQDEGEVELLRRSRLLCKNKNCLPGWSLVASLAAALAVTFIMVQCLNVISTGIGPAIGRRLAEGGERPACTMLLDPKGNPVGGNLVGYLYVGDKWVERALRIKKPLMRKLRRSAALNFPEEAANVGLGISPKEVEAFRKKGKKKSLRKDAVPETALTETDNTRRPSTAWTRQTPAKGTSQAHKGSATSAFPSVSPESGQQQESRKWLSKTIQPATGPSSVGAQQSPLLRTLSFKNAEESLSSVHPGSSDSLRRRNIPAGELTLQQQQISARWDNPGHSSLNPSDSFKQTLYNSQGLRAPYLQSERGQQAPLQLPPPKQMRAEGGRSALSSVSSMSPRSQKRSHSLAFGAMADPFSPFGSTQETITTVANASTLDTGNRNFPVDRLDVPPTPETIRKLSNLPPPVKPQMARTQVVFPLYGTGGRSRSSSRQSTPRQSRRPTPRTPRRGLVSRVPSGRSTSSRGGVLPQTSVTQGSLLESLAKLNIGQSGTGGAPSSALGSGSSLIHSPPRWGRMSTSQLPLGERETGLGDLRLEEGRKSVSGTADGRSDSSGSTVILPRTRKFSRLTSVSSNEVVFTVRPELSDDSSLALASKSPPIIPGTPETSSSAAKASLDDSAVAPLASEETVSSFADSAEIPGSSIILSGELSEGFPPPDPGQGHKGKLLWHRREVSAPRGTPHPRVSFKRQVDVPAFASKKKHSSPDPYSSAGFMHEEAPSTADADGWPSPAEVKWSEESAPAPTRQPARDSSFQPPRVSFKVQAQVPAPASKKKYSSPEPFSSAGFMYTEATSPPYDESWWGPNNIKEPEPSAPAPSKRRATPDQFSPGGSFFPGAQSTVGIVRWRSPIETEGGSAPAPTIQSHNPDQSLSAVSFLPAASSTPNAGDRWGSTEIRGASEWPSNRKLFSKSGFLHPVASSTPNAGNRWGPTKTGGALAWASDRQQTTSDRFVSAASFVAGAASMPVAEGSWDVQSPQVSKRRATPGGFTSAAAFFPEAYSAGFGSQWGATETGHPGYPGGYEDAAASGAIGYGSGSYEQPEPSATPYSYASSEASYSETSSDVDSRSTSQSSELNIPDTPDSSSSARPRWAPKKSLFMPIARQGPGEAGSVLKPTPQKLEGKTELQNMLLQTASLMTGEKIDTSGWFDGAAAWGSQQQQGAGLGHQAGEGVQSDLGGDRQRTPSESLRMLNHSGFSAFARFNPHLQVPAADEDPNRSGESIWSDAEPSWSDILAGLDEVEFRHLPSEAGSTYSTDSGSEIVSASQLLPKRTEH